MSPYKLRGLSKFAFKLHCTSYCTMDRMDGTTESYCLYTYALSYCPSRPIVPWTGWMYNGIQLYIYICFIQLSIHSYCTMDTGQDGRYDGILLSMHMRYPVVHPVLLYHGQDGRYNGIQLSIYICFILLSIPSYCTMDRMDSTIESNCLYTYALSYCPSRPIVPWTGWTVR